VGTSSLRRSAQLRQLRPDLVVEPVRGNVDTRLRKLDEGQYDAILLAAAGLKRLGFAARIVETLAPAAMCPAVGQGALAIEARTGFTAAAALDHAPTRAAVTAERAMLLGLGGGCMVPIGAHGVVENGRLRLDGMVIAPDGTRSVRDAVEGAASEAERLGRALAAKLLERGAGELLAAKI
ncbi:MAG: hydroxymethylbilane synthase, partial [Bryobacteraceae bacterium]